MNIVLIGFRGSGKSSVGKELASRLGRIFIDCDEYIEHQTGLSIREIFKLSGESHFRTLESQAINELTRLEDKVLATGGGAVMKHRNLKALKSNESKIIYLQVEPETAIQRMEEDPTTRERRPALTDQDPITEARQQIECRQPYYRDGADITIKTDGRSIDDIVAMITAYLKDFGIEERRDGDAGAETV